MSSTMLIINLLIAIGFILFLIIKVKLNPAIALIIGSILMGVISKLPLTSVVTGITSGFGGLMAGIGLSIGFGIILGQLLSDCGGAKRIAASLVKLFPDSKAIYALGIAAFVLSVPVFFDVTFVILIPIGVALMKEIKKSIAYIVGAIAIGAGVAHTMVPPTPNPLAAAEIFGFDLGIMVIGGFLVGLTVVLITITIYMKILDKGLWKSEKDENGLGIVDVVSKSDSIENPPSVFASLIPILLPVILILLNTVSNSMMETPPVIFQFLGDKTIALLIGVLAAYIIASKSMEKKQLEDSASEALKAAGIVFLITGAGGAFGKIIELTGINEAMVEMITNFSSSIVVVLLISYVTGVIFRQVTGSGTVASITTMTIMASVAASVNIHPVFIALACLSGALFGATINDSGFWIVSNLCGFNVTGGMKTYTLGQAIASLVSITIVISTALIFSLF